jgi:CubicO group peptidase (beta-lactamase class C family)
MAPKLSTETTSALCNYIINATTGPSSTIPGAVLHIIDAQTNTLFTHASSPSATLSAQSISIVQSLTKLVGAIAFMQLVERGITSLDDPAIIPTHLPELAAKQILTGYTTDSLGKKTWHLEDRKSDIIPRMLMNHTYGGGHTYMDQILFEYFQDEPDIDWAITNEAVDTYGTLLASPLLYQPGAKTTYGQGLDWLAVLIERLTGQKLAEYLQENVFEPLGLKSMGFEPGFGGSSLLREENGGKFWPRVLRTPEGYVTLDPPNPPTVTHPDAFPNGTYHTGRLGTGLISSAADYARLLTILLPANAGVDPITKHRILAPSSVEEITSPQLSPALQHDSRTITASTASPIILPAHLQSVHMDPDGSYGLGCGVQGADRVLKDGGKGRKKGSVYWYGAANTDYWVDMEMGIVVFVNANYYPWNDEAWLEFVASVEGIVYGGLE